jgi:hypothetical protein
MHTLKIHPDNQSDMLLGKKLILPKNTRITHTREIKN